MLKHNGNDLPILLDCGLINDAVSTTQDNHRQKKDNFDVLYHTPFRGTTF
jgi:hypothetical protein